jgi:antitoxin component YwqK of YwqJK toxin-antitoxin module
MMKEENIFYNNQNGLMYRFCTLNGKKEGAYIEFFLRNRIQRISFYTNGIKEIREMCFKRNGCCYETMDNIHNTRTFWNNDGTLHTDLYEKPFLKLL